MRLKILIVGLCLCVSAKNDDEAYKMHFRDNLASSPNDQLITSMASRSGKRSCKTDLQEDGICVKRSDCTSQVLVTGPTAFYFRESNTCLVSETCCLSSKVSSRIVKPGCGWSNPGGIVFAKKTADGLAEYGEFPWMVALIKKGSEIRGWEEQYAGGGALIHPSVVITGAYKVDDYEPNDLKIRAGEWDTRSVSEAEPYQERDVRKILIHEKYFNVHSYNNVALLFLTSPVDLSVSHIGLACLASHLPPPGTRCYSMGWGKDFLNSEKYSVKLKKLELPLVDAASCQQQYKNTRLGSQFRLHHSLTCAGGEEGVDTCEGDGGSPLVCPMPGQPQRFVVVGMVVYGLGCGTTLPGVYVKVPQFYDWTGGQLTLEGLNKTTFEYEQ